MNRAYVFTEYGGPENQEFQQLSDPSPGPSELLIAVRAAGVNPVDWKIRAGYLRQFMPLDLPAVLGQEAAGVVEQVGQDVDGFAVGDEVFGSVAPGSGGYAERALLTAGVAAKKPTAVSFTDAATLPVAAATAYDGLVQLNLLPGQTLLINGIGGGVGVAAAQLARDRGLTVVGVASEEKRELVESLGAMQVTSGDGVAGRVRELLPEGVEAILDLVGGDSLRAVAGLAPRGPMIVTTADPGTAAEVGGVSVERNRSGDVLTRVAALVADGKLDPHVTEVLPFAEAGAALQAVERGHARGKVVISM
jgi:NADPH:quinone reductase-like Zn-dependent oxidoreductase